MMKSSDFKQIAKKLIKQQQGLHDVQIMHPAREWHLGIMLALLIVGSSVIYSTSTYYKNKRADMADITIVESDPVVYRENMVAEALANLQKRDSIRESLINEMPVPVEVADLEIATSSPAEEVGTSTEATEEVEETEAEEVPTIPAGTTPQSS